MLVSGKLFYTAKNAYSRASRTIMQSARQSRTLTATLPFAREGYSALRLGSIAVALSACLAISYSSSSKAVCDDKFSSTKMYPAITAYDTGTIKVDDLHTVAYSCYGNPKGKAVLFVHGGPGGGTDPGTPKYFGLQCFLRCKIQ